MDLRQGSKISLLLQLATAHGLTMGTADQWQFSAAVALTDDVSGLNTKVKLTALASNVNYSKNRTFKYNRRSLAELKLNYSSTPTLALTGVSRVYDCFPYLLRMTGVLFSADDVEDGDLVDNGDGTFTIPLTAKVTGILWTGSWQFKTGLLPAITRVLNPAYFDWS